MEGLNWEWGVRAYRWMSEGNSARGDMHEKVSFTQNVVKNE